MIRQVSHPCWHRGLRAIVAGTAAATGDEFFRALVSNLAAALRVSYAFVSEFTQGNTTVRTLACWTGEGFVDNFEYDVAGTPCEQVLWGDARHYSEGIQALFPKDTQLVDWGAESYLAIPLTDPTGNVLGHLAVVDDKAMAEPRDMPIFKIFAARAAAELLRQRAEEERRKSEERFHKIFDYSNDAIFIIDPPQGEILDVNSKACEMLGYSRQRLTSMSISDVHPNEMPALRAFADSVSRNGHGWTSELTCLTSSGTFLPAEISASIIDISGRPCMIALVRDIRERKLAEEALLRANLRMKGELEAAAKVQHSLLAKAPPDLPEVSFGWAFRPCEEAAGDILDVYRLDKERVGLYLLDVSGHGVVASLLSVTLNRVLSPEPSLTSVLKQYVGNSQYRLLSPPDVAQQLNSQFPFEPTRPQYFTLLFGILDLRTNDFRYVSAGHPGPVHQSQRGDPMILETPGFPIGLLTEANWEEQVLHLDPGDRLYLYSDGVTESANGRGEEFGPERLLEAIGQSRAKPLQESLSSLLSSVEEWRGGTGLEDDISILAVEMTR